MTIKLSKTAPPIPLSAEETTLYKYIVNFLKDNNALNPIDSLSIAQAAKCYFRMQEAEEEAYQKGWTQEFENGNNISAYATRYWKEAALWLEYTKMFGLTTKARDTIKIFRADEGSQKGFLRHLSVLHKKAANG